MRRLYRRKGRKNRIRVGNLLSVGTICIVLVLAFGALGASYASWSQTFKLTGSINTGNINVIITDVEFETSDVVSPVYI